MKELQRVCLLLKSMNENNTKKFLVDSGNLLVVDYLRM